LDFLTVADRIQEWGPELVYLGIYLMLVVSALGIPLPEDLTLLAAGYLINRSLLHPVPAVAVGILGVLTGDFLGHSLGRLLGPRIWKQKRFSRVLTEKRYRWIRGKFDRHGEKMVFFARFVSGLRGPVFVTSGIMEMSRARFLLYDFAGAVISVPLFLLIGHLSGPHLETALIHLVRARTTVLLLLGLAAIALALRALARRRLGVDPGKSAKD
jgi:membrane protein DedA with SNARE-associated domain